ncbi:hypothetical protein AB0L97_18765, partial [Nocardia sp. NPDC051911]
SNPYRHHLRHRRTEEPGVAVLHLFHEIKALGYTGGLNLLHELLRHRTDPAGIAGSPQELRQSRYPTLPKLLILDRIDAQAHAF